MFIFMPAIRLMNRLSFASRLLTTYRLIAFVFMALAGNAQADIVLGQIAPYSGPLAPTGKGMRAGIQLCLDAANAAGGIHGQRLRLVSADDGYKSSETVRLAQEMAREQRPLAFIGMVGTGNVEALLKENVLGQTGIPLIAARSGASTLTTPPHAGLFLTRASYDHEISRMVAQYVPLGYRRIAVFYQNDPFGLDGLKSLENAVQKQGAELVARASYEKNTTQVDNAVKTLAEAKPQLVVMISNTAASAEFVRQFRATGVYAQLAALSVTDGTQVVEKIGAQMAHGLAISQVVPDPADLSSPLIREIQEKARKHLPRDVPLNQTVVEGYLGAKVLLEGIRRAGAEVTSKKLRDALEDLRNYDAGGLSISFSPDNHVGSRYSDITILNRSGRLLR